MNIEDLANSLTGFDEIAIEQAFHKPLPTLSDTMQARALYFVALRRDGSKDSEAYGAVMRAPLSEIMAAIQPVDTAESEGKESQHSTETSLTPIL